jgi:hypothetical protein
MTHKEVMTAGNKLRNSCWIPRKVEMDDGLESREFFVHRACRTGVRADLQLSPTAPGQ